MPDEILDLHEPYPNVVIDQLRRAVVQAIDDLTEQVDRLKSVFLLLSVTGDMAQATKNSVIGGQQAIAQMQATATALGQQLSAVNTRAEAAAIDANTALANCDQLQTQMADVLNRLAALENPTTPEA